MSLCRLRHISLYNCLRMYNVHCCSKLRQNNARGTGFTSVFGLLTEAYFSCFKNCCWEEIIWRPSLQAAHGSWEISNIFTVILNCFLILYAWVPVWRLFANFNPNPLNSKLLQNKMWRLGSRPCKPSGLSPWRAVLGETFDHWEIPFLCQKCNTAWKIPSLICSLETACPGCFLCFWPIEQRYLHLKFC